MPDFDYPGPCQECSNESKECAPTEQHKLHETYLQEEGYTKTLITELQTALPDKFNTPEEAARAYDVFKTTIVNGLKNRDAVDLIGIGEFRSEPGGKSGARGKSIVFTPDPRLIQGASE